MTTHIPNVQSPWPATLPLNVALGIMSGRELMEAHGVDEDTLKSWLRHDLFKQEVAAHKADMKASGNSFRAKARAQAEALLDYVYFLVTDTEVPAAVRMKGIENMVQWAQFEGQEKPSEALTQQGPSLTLIVQGAEAAPPPIEVEAQKIS